MVSLVQAATSTPFFLLTIPAGAMADIVDRRRYLIGTQIWMAAYAGSLGILTLTGVTGSLLLCLYRGNDRRKCRLGQVAGLLNIPFALAIAACLYVSGVFMSEHRTRPT
jgi:MFS family permease